MRLELSFRLLNHLTLALACLSLIAAEDFFLPWIWYLAGPVLLLIALGAWSEGRWQLPATVANGLGAVIGVGSVWWVIRSLEASGYFSATFALPLSAAVVPYLGPSLLALMMVKLFRPRTPRDFWMLQGLALLQVGLGCVLAGGPLFGAFLAAYVVCALGCLALHHLREPKESAANSKPLPYSGLLLPFLARWAPAVAVPSLLLFLALPRSPFHAWNPQAIFTGRGSNPFSQTGYGDGINLNRTGTVEISDDPAFQVRVTDREGRPREDLPLNQRWRGAALEYYTEGMWSTQQRIAGRMAERPGQQDLPDLGAEELLLDFSVEPRRAGGLFLADPVRLGPADGPRLPVVRRDGDNRPLFFELYSGVVAVPAPPNKQCGYRQVLLLGADPERTPAEGLSPWLRKPTRAYDDREQRRATAAISYFVEMKSSSVSTFADFTTRLLQRLIEEEQYDLREEDAAWPVVVGQLRVPDNAERVARALTALLATSGEYTYSLELQRHNPKIDPVLDFLLNVKQGHCERYASALALMLRSRQIPARIVKGFRGCDYQGDGVYIVRQRHAHSWVEALVPRPDGNGFDWLTLDPTPDIEAPAAPAPWYCFGWPNWDSLWRDLIQDYDTDRQTTLWNRLFRRRSLFRNLGILAVLAGSVGLMAAGRAWLRRPRRKRHTSDDGPPESARPAMACLARLLDLLARRYHLVPSPTQTPREFAEIAGRALRSRPETEAFANLPCSIVAIYYRARFGGELISSDELQELEQRLERLAALSSGMGTKRI